MSGRDVSSRPSTNGRRRRRRAPRPWSQDTSAPYRALVQNASDVVGLVDESGLIRYLTPSVERVLGYTPSDLEGQTLADLIHPRDVERAVSFLADTRDQRGATAPTEWRVRHRDGTWIHLETVGTNLLADPTVRSIVLTARDVTERKVVERQLAKQAFHDPLTGLANRSLLKDRVQRANLRDRRSFTLLFLDLDNFKHVNDSLGHAVGDQLLVEVASRIQQCVRPIDTAARLGGDEFAVFLEDSPDIEDAITVAERIIESLKTPIKVSGKTAFTSTSIGIAPGSLADSTDELLRNADIAMYRAKTRGKGQHVVFRPSMHAEALERIELESALHGAIERSELLLHYQPIIELESGQIMGLEALVRWQHPTRGLLGPAAFIPIAEETGLIKPIGTWVLNEACERLAGWQRDHPQHRPLSMSVNLSGRQLDDDDLLDHVAEAFRTSGIDPASMILEITETAMMKDTEVNAQRLTELKGLGLRLAVDDFGIGYSSLHYLHTFPIDLLKLAKQFVEGVASDEQKAAFAHTIMDLCRTLGLSALAEGIESNAQAEALRALRCGLGQGYYLSRPLDQDRTDALLGQGDALRRYAEEVRGSGPAREDTWWSQVTGRSRSAVASRQRRRAGANGAARI